jgi:hypothetical protein
MVKKDPTLLRYGVLGVCYLGARMYAIDRRQPQMWDGSAISGESPSNRLNSSSDHLLRTCQRLLQRPWVDPGAL